MNRDSLNRLSKLKLIDRYLTLQRFFVDTILDEEEPPWLTATTETAIITLIDREIGKLDYDVDDDLDDPEELPSKKPKDVPAGASSRFDQIERGVYELTAKLIEDGVSLDAVPSLKALHERMHKKIQEEQERAAAKAERERQRLARKRERLERELAQLNATTTAAPKKTKQRGIRRRLNLKHKP